MQKSTFIVILIPLLMLAIAMTYRYYNKDSMTQIQRTNSVNSAKAEIMVDENITKLKEFGIDATSVEEKITESIASFPAEIYEVMEPEQITGIILTQIAWMLYDNDEANQPVQARQFFTFDVECMDPDSMYTFF